MYRDPPPPFLRDRVGDAGARAACGPQYHIPVLEERLCCGGGSDGAQEATGHGLSDPVDSYVGNALLVEGSVNRYDVLDVADAKELRRVVEQLKAPLVDGQRCGRLPLGVLAAPLLRTVVHFLGGGRRSRRQTWGARVFWGPPLRAQP